MFGRGMLGVFPAGLGTLPGKSSGIFGTPSFARGNWVTPPFLSDGLTIIGSILLIFELGDSLAGLTDGLMGAGAVVRGAGVISLEGTAASGCLVAGTAAFGFIMRVILRVPLFRDFLTLFCLLLILV